MNVATKFTLMALTLSITTSVMAAELTIGYTQIAKVLTGTMFLHVIDQQCHFIPTTSYSGKEIDYFGGKYTVDKINGKKLSQPEIIYTLWGIDGQCPYGILQTTANDHFIVYGGGGGSPNPPHFFSYNGQYYSHDDVVFVKDG